MLFWPTMNLYSVAAILSETVQKSKWIVMILGVNLGYHSKKLYPLINDQYTVRPNEAFRFAVGSFIENVRFVLVYRQTKANVYYIYHGSYEWTYLNQRIHVITDPMMSKSWNNRPMASKSWNNIKIFMLDHALLKFTISKLIIA